MGLFAILPTLQADDNTLQLKFDRHDEEQVENNKIMLPAEWFPQSGVQLTWPHEATDWKPLIKEVTATYLSMAYEIACREQLIIVASDVESVKATISSQLPSKVHANIHYIECPTNDTWARDHGFITVTSETGYHLLDFKFNGWGEKFEASLDNAINKHLFDTGVLNGIYESHLDFVLEGGSIESDGKGTIFTTSSCLMAPHRNQPKGKRKIEKLLMKYFCAERVVWIDHGLLMGDDTDGHIDTLVRICPNDTLLYVGCEEAYDPQYEALREMEQQLMSLKTIDGHPYRLLKLPMPDAIYYEGERLPATYANFLIMNHTVLFPTYNQRYHDEEARKTIQKAFKNYDIVGIDSRPLIRQHGSLHCCTMQYPSGCIKTTDE